MRINLLKLVYFFLFCPVFCWGQFEQKEKELISKFEAASTDGEKIEVLASLSELYYVYKLDIKGDSVLQKQLLIAEQSSDKDLIRSVLFSNSILNVSSWSSIATFDRTINFIQKGLAYANEINRNDLAAIAHIREATIYRRRSKYDDAMQQATLAFSSLGNDPHDSIKTILYLELGDIYMAKGDVVPAYKNYNNAFDLAYKQKNFSLESETYHHYSALYRSLENNDLAKANLLKSLELNTQQNNTEGLLIDYIDLARLTNEKDYIEKAYKLADSLRSEKYKLASKRLMFSYYMVVVARTDQTLNYFYSNNDLVQYFRNSGISQYYLNLGYIYYYSGNHDSAIHYFKIGEKGLENTYDKSVRLSINLSLAKAYDSINDPENAIRYYEIAYTLGKELNSLSSLPSITASLDNLYARQLKFQLAYKFAKESALYNNTIQKLKAQREVALLEVNQENRKREKDAQDLANKTLKRRNLQYMGITMSLALLFLGMLIIGMFPVSKTTIRLLGYFAFISLFEFIIVLIDGFIHRLAHGEPLKIWLIKIVLIALLVPFQHYLEHGLIKFLASRKLIAARNKFSIKKLWQNIKKPAPKPDDESDFEEDTAVL